MSLHILSVHETWTSGCFRLKVLKDEIRKPYFIKLKDFLWEQGVKGPNDSSKSLRIYPARKISSWPCAVRRSNGRHSSEHLLLVQFDAARACQGRHYRAGSLSRPKSSSRCVGMTSRY